MDKIIKALTIEYIAAYVVNLENDSFSVLKQSEFGNAFSDDSVPWSIAASNFAETCSRDSEKIVKSFSDIIYLKSLLAQQDSFEILFKLAKTDTEIRKTVAQVIERQGDTPSKLLVTISSADKYFSKKDTLAKIIDAQQNAYINQKNNLINSLPLYKFLYSRKNDDESSNLFDQIRILLVEDSEMLRGLTKGILVDEGAIVCELENGQQAVDEIQSGGKYDLIIMDIVMPVLDGVSATKEIVEFQRNQESRPPIVGLISEGAPEQVGAMVKAGAFACLEKPLNPKQLSTVLISSMKQQFSVMEEKLSEIKLLANTDMLTQTGNIVAYTNYISELSKKISENELEVGIVFCDLDNLKGINDTHGHDIGDIYIKNCCSLITSVFPKSSLYRIGGDEFAVIVLGEELKNIDKCIFLLNEKSRKLNDIDDVASGKASVSSGFAIYDSEIDKSLSDTMKRADMAMYENKMLHKKWLNTYKRFR